MDHFASGWKQNYYGKGDVIVYRLNRDWLTPPGALPVFGANVTMLIYGDAFWPTYETGDNTGLIATDSMKNFIQRETLNYTGYDLESYCHFLAALFLETYPHVEGTQISATAIPYLPVVEGRWRSHPAVPTPPAPLRIAPRRRGSGIGGTALRHTGLPPAPPRRQRLPWLCARSVHHAARHPQSAAAHVARSWTGSTPSPMPRIQQGR